LAQQQMISKDDLDEVQNWLMQKHFREARMGKLILGPAIAVFSLAMLARGEGLWRLWIVLGIVAIAGFRIAASRHACDPHDVPERMAKEKVWLPVILCGILLITGAFDSPLLPMIGLFCFMFGTLAPRRLLKPFAIMSAAAILFLAAASSLELMPNIMPTIFGGGAHSPQPDKLIWWKAGFYVLAISWAYKMSSTIRDVFRQIATDAIESRDEILRTHDAHTRELTAMTGELAHELKNPLANIKGLAVLIGRDVQGKAAERLGVLQGEVDRLNGILQGFLTFSRPVVPLSQEEVEMGELCDSVRALHEGVAHDGGVTLVTPRAEEVAHLRASCDSRKVKQILINLVQNAIDASPRGTQIELVPLPDASGGVRIEVRDRGPGIAASLRGHLFEPGMTTKEKGSGLGLALARALARQHGGEVALGDREGGGSLAVLTLPRAPAFVRPVEAA
jgi:two-component system sensor histidine kinase HydH